MSSPQAVLAGIILSNVVPYLETIYTLPTLWRQDQYECVSTDPPRSWDWGTDSRAELQAAVQSSTASLSISKGQAKAWSEQLASGPENPQDKARHCGTN